MFSALMPTKGRVALAQRAIESIHATARGPIEILLGVDESEVIAYRSCEEIMFAFPDGHGGSWKMHRLAKEASGDAMMCFHDDMVAITPGWDIRFLDALRKDPYRVLYFMDDKKQHRGLVEPVVSRQWLEAGGFYPDFFHHYHGDTFCRTIAERLNRLDLIDDVVIEHRHFKNGTSEYDATYKARDSEEKVDWYRVQKAQRAAMKAINERAATTYN